MIMLELGWRLSGRRQRREMGGLEVDEKRRRKSGLRSIKSAFLTSRFPSALTRRKGRLELIHCHSSSFRLCPRRSPPSKNSTTPLPRRLAHASRVETGL